jgi:hypothetical protein
MSQVFRNKALRIKSVQLEKGGRLQSLHFSNWIDFNDLIHGHTPIRAAKPNK